MTIIEYIMDPSANTLSENTPPPQPEVLLVNVPVTDDNAALNVLVGFVGIAQKRGAFNIQESAKIWECVQRFTQGAEP